MVSDIMKTHISKKYYVGVSHRSGEVKKAYVTITLVMVH